MEQGELIISIEKGQIHYGDHKVLDSIDIELRKGEFVYLIGKTGSGKSSLLNVIYGETKLSGGHGTAVGFDLMTLKPKSVPMLRRKIGNVFQDFKLLYDRTVYENLRFVLEATDWKGKNKINDQIEKVLKMVGIVGKNNNYPHQLSGGEQQRVSIARALLNEPDLIIADEPTGSLDPETAREVMDLLMSISQQGVTIFMATHHYKTIETYPGRIYQCVNRKAQEMAIKYS
ncbi:ATP-binding cassette domain-containing protein [Flavobacteriales bacterium]|jgi:cell division transport system ATP-binding protein|nr:ATP-binding cassette domain-containing protein [Flavobacteriales bacterium]MDA9776016.1 ATP-binding cassette domain-containing protein [Flavobacteriales bacterium]MDG1174593.1 ATP-binding cassette domain-containing protein [Flavobacteriales bacterium]